MRNLALLILSLVMPSPLHADTAYPGAIPDLRVAKGTGIIAEAWLADATDRYRHFVLGSRYEAASLVVRLRDGRMLKLTLSDTHVFEDRELRLADLDGDGTDEVLVVKTDRGAGAALVVVAMHGDTLRIVAETPPTGSPNTWLNSAGIADFTGDGRLDIAYVQMPHVLGRLRLWTMRNGQLVEIATLEDTSNHAAGSPHLRLSAIADVDGDGLPDLIIPTLDRRRLRAISFKNGLSKELGSRPLPKAAYASVTLLSAKPRPHVRVTHADGSTTDIRF